MKQYLLLVFVLVAGLLPAKEEGSPGKYFIAAISFGGNSAVPATLRISTRDGKTMANLYLNGEMRIAPVVLRVVPDLVASNPKQTMFDAVFISKDGLSSIILTGRFFEDATDWNGTGEIVMHTAAKFGAAPGAGLTEARISTGAFSITKPEDEPKAESDDKPSK